MPAKQVIADNYWGEVARIAKGARRKQAAIAFVTRDLVGFRRGDRLIVNASEKQIANGSTDARLLLALQKKGVEIFGCDNLHAKVLVLGNYAVIGSGNMSVHSKSWLEAAYLTNDAIAVAGAKAFLEKVVSDVEPPMTREELLELRKIKVVRRGGGRPPTHGRRVARVGALGNRTWLVSVRELPSDPPPREQAMIDKAAAELSLAKDRLDWIRMVGTGKLVRECRRGDQIIVMWRPLKGAVTVYRAAPLLLVQRTSTWTRLYYETPTGRGATRPWAAFVSLAKRAKHTRKLSPTSTQLLKPDVAERLLDAWTSRAK